MDIPDVEEALAEQIMSSSPGILTTMLKVVRLRRAEPISITEIKAQTVSLQSEATIAAFLAAVQAQIVAISIANNDTHLQKAINALGFMGVIFNVGGTFLALLSSTLIQTNQIRLESFMENLKKSRLSSLGLALRQMEDIEYLEQISPLGITMLIEVGDIISKKKKRREEGLEDLDETDIVSQLLDLYVLDGICRYIGRFKIIGNTAGTVILYGFFCLVISVLLLAINTNSTAVWIPTVVACASIVFLPIVNRLLATVNRALLNPFELRTNRRKWSKKQLSGSA